MQCADPQIEQKTHGALKVCHQHIGDAGDVKLILYDCLRRFLPDMLRVNHCPAWVEYHACTLGISVGQAYHEGDKFAATVEWAARHFDYIRVDVSDTLQRHRHVAAGIGYSEAEAHARDMGEAWMVGAFPILEACGKDWRFVLWDTWLWRNDFGAVLEAYTALVEHHPLLTPAFQEDIDGFLQRYIAQGNLRDNEALVRATSRGYLLEELAAITLQGRALRSARIYPGPELQSFAVIRGGQVPEAPQGLENDYYVHTNLQHRQGATPQAAFKIA